MLTDEQIAAMTPHQRRELIARLARPAAEVLPSPPTARRLRSARLLVTVVGCAALVPWTAYLAATLPRRYVVRHWDLVWVGYDLLLVALLAATAWLTWRRRQAVVLTSFTTGVLLLVDVWFDVLTANRSDAWVSLTVAVFVEVPVAALLLWSAVRTVRLTAARFWVLTPGMRFWQIPLMVLSGVDPQTLDHSPPGRRPR